MKKIFLIVVLSALVFSCTNTDTKVKGTVNVEIMKKQLTQKVIEILKSDIPHEQRIKKTVYLLNNTFLPVEVCMLSVKDALHMMDLNKDENMKIYFLIEKKLKSFVKNKGPKRLPKQLLGN